MADPTKPKPCSTCGGRPRSALPARAAGEPAPDSPLGRFKVLRSNGIYYTFTTLAQAQAAAARWGVEVIPMAVPDADI